MFLEISQNSQENTRARVSFAGLKPATLLKKTLAQVFSCEFYEISKNTFFTEHLFTEHLWTTASVYSCIVVDIEWSIPSTFSQEYVKQIELIQTISSFSKSSWAEASSNEQKTCHLSPNNIILVDCVIN